MKLCVKKRRIKDIVKCFNCTILADTIFLTRILILGKTLGNCKGDNSTTRKRMKKKCFHFFLRGRMEPSNYEYVYFCAQKSSIKTGNNKFQDLINAPRIS